MRRAANSQTNAGPAKARAFTLVEMLVVLAIIGILLALTIPHFRHMNEGRVMEAASRQLMSDLAYARQAAIANRGTTAMVFVPLDVTTTLTSTDTNDAALLKDLQAGLYTSYAIVALRQAGEQPGRSTIRYLTQWRSLPEKTFIAESKFVAEANGGFFTNRFPFPRATSPNNLDLPYIAFDPQGRCIRLDPQKGTLGTGQPAGDVYVPLASGSILYTRDANGNVIDYTVQEVPPNNSVTTTNVIHIDWLTGRAKLERSDIVTQ